MICRSLALITCAVWVQMAHAQFNCKAPGKFMHSEDRSKYHECHFVGENKFSYFLESCPKDTCFDPADQTCGIVHCDSQMMEVPSDFKCSKPGKFPHVDPARKDGYYKCINANEKLYLYEYQCLPTKACFVENKQACQVC